MGVKKWIFILVILAVAALGAVRTAQVISNKKAEKPTRHGRGQAPLVETAIVTQGPIEEKIFRAGDIAPTAQVTVFSKVQGWVEQIKVREGDRVRTGQVLVTLDAREAKAAEAQAKANLEAAEARLKQVRATSAEAVQSEIQHAKADLDLCQANLKRARELSERNFIARQQLDEAQNKYDISKATYDLALNNLSKKTWENDIALAEAQVRQARASLELVRAQLANLVILSPMNGSVTKRYVDPGTMVKDTTAILTLMDLSEVKMVVNMIEKEFVHLRKGQPVKLTVAAFPNRVFPGRITIITPALELQSRTAEIQIAIPNPGETLKPGMFGRAEILLRSTLKATLVPIQGLISDDKGDAVFILKGNRAHRQPVRKGLVKDNFAEILEGVSPGERIVTAGSDSLQDGSSVRLAANQDKN
jgi:multidrug efflux pump subunit AcrA (membrane-fusion protein)